MKKLVGIEVDKNIDMPEQVGGRTPKYPWKKMKVGDSFLFPRGTDRSKAYSGATQASKRYKMKFSVRVVDGSFRCWRVK